MSKSEDYCAREFIPEDKPPFDFWTSTEESRKVAKKVGQLAREMVFNWKTTPTRIIRNGPATIVMWKDGTKTIVKKSDDTIDDPYGAFCAALAKKVYGSNSRVHKLVAMTENYNESGLDGLAARLEKALDSLSENLKRIKR